MVEYGEQVVLAHRNCISLIKSIVNDRVVCVIDCPRMVIQNNIDTLKETIALVNVEFFSAEKKKKIVENNSLDTNYECVSWIVCLLSFILFFLAQR